jgi:hypothetical protein
MRERRRLKQVFSETVLNELGKAMVICQREHKITPYRLVLSLLCSIRIKYIFGNRR